MGAFVDRDDVKVVQDKDWKPWEKATIGKLDSAAHDRIRAEVFIVTGASQRDEEGRLIPMTKTQHTFARVPVAYEGLLAGGSNWTFTKNGKPPSESNPSMPITRETVGMLTRRRCKFLYEETEEFNADWTDEERAAFFRSTGRSVQGGQSVSP